MTGTGKYESLLTGCAELDPVPTAVAHPCEASALAGAIEAGEKKLITPILVGPAAKIRAVATPPASRSAPFGFVDAAHSHESAAKAVALVRSGEAELLMKGSLHTDELLGAVVARDTGSVPAAASATVFVMDVPTYHKVMIVTDAAINIAPTLEDKVDICQNAIDLAISLGVERRRSRSSRRSRPSTRRCRRRSTPRRCARWPSAARSPAACSTARSPSTTRSAGRGANQGHRVGVAGDPDILLVPDLEPATSSPSS
jgi:phosphotransacetylase